MPTKTKPKAKAKASSSTSSRMTKQRAMTKAGYQHIAGWVPAELAKELRRAIAAAAPGQGGARAKPTKPAPRKRVAPASSPADQIDAGALPSTPRGRARAAQIAASFA